MEKTVILHVCSIDNDKCNGVSVVVPNHFKYQARIEKVGLLNCSSIKIDCLSQCNNVFLYKDYKKISSLPKPFDHPNLVVFHEVYKPQFIFLYNYLIKNNIPYIIIPHGCLTQNAQNIKRIKKSISNYLVFNRFINNAKKIQFLSEQEKNMSIKYSNGFVLGNGMEVSNIYKKQKRKDNIKFVYVGRYSIYHKGLDIILDYCNNNREILTNNNVTIYFYGSGTDEDIKKLKFMIKKYKLDKIVKIGGPVYDDEKKKTIVSCDYFIQLSRLEGQPLGVMEALMLGIPSILSDGTTFGSFVEKYNCGYRCNSNNDFKKIINKIMESDYIKMSKNARKSAIDNFGWDRLSRNILNKYKEIIRESD